MTKVEIRYSLPSQAEGILSAALDRATGIYGLRSLQVSQAGDELKVEYDASRLRPEDVDAALRRAGLTAHRIG